MSCPALFRGMSWPSCFQENGETSEAKSYFLCKTTSRCLVPALCSMECHDLLAFKNTEKHRRPNPTFLNLWVVLVPLFVKMRRLWCRQINQSCIRLAALFCFVPWNVMTFLLSRQRRNLTRLCVLQQKSDILQHRNLTRMCVLCDRNRTPSTA